jgi:hypothetical protein
LGYNGKKNLRRCEMMRERELLRGSFWILPWKGAKDLDMEFLGILSESINCMYL